MAWSEQLNEEMGIAAVTVSWRLMGSTCGRGTPLAVRAARGIWKARLVYALPLEGGVVVSVQKISINIKYKNTAQYVK